MNIASFAIKIAKFIYAPWIWIIKHFTRIEENFIVFESVPSYSDNSRALSEYLLNKGYQEKYKIFWSVKNAKYYRKKYKNVDIVFLENNMFHPMYFCSLWYFYRAKFLFGTHGIIISKENCRKEQVSVRLWHGCSYKDKSEADIKKVVPFDFALVSGPIFQKIKSYYWNCNLELVHPLGFPRYDWLLNPSNKAISLYKRLKGSSSKLIIWMPTFRNAKNSRLQGYKDFKHFPLLSTEEEWIELDKECQKNNCKLAVKVHTFQLDYGIDYSKFSNIICITNLTFDRENIAMYEFISLTDALVSDYSSVAIDYLIVNKPIGFALDDYDEYKEQRGFVFDNPLDYMPGHHLFNLTDLYSFIRDVASGNDKYEKKRKGIKQLCIAESNHYCKDIVSALNL